MLFILSALVVKGQDLPLPDGVINHYHTLKTKKEKSTFLWSSLESVLYDNHGINTLLKIKIYFDQKEDESASNLIQLAIALRINRNGDYLTSLNMSLPVLSSCEDRKDTIGIIKALGRISNSYEFAKNYEQAISWQKKSFPNVIALTRSQFLN